MIKLHLGCFDVPLEGWYNTDITMHLVAARIPLFPSLLYSLRIIERTRFRQHKEGVFRKVHYLNALKRFHFANDSVDAVFSSHMIDNFTREEAVRCLKEVHRVLKPGSVLRLAMVDLDEWVRRYDANDPDPFLSALFLPYTKKVKNRLQWLYNKQSAKRLLEESGFRNVTPCRRFEGTCPDLDRTDRRDTSMYIEGFK